MRYREIWNAWLELLRMHKKTELEWMWQHRTFMELLAVRAAMKLQAAVRKQFGGGILAHAPVLGAKESPSQGKYLANTGIESKLLAPKRDTGKFVGFRSGDKVERLGAIADVGPETTLWWNVTAIPAGENSGADDLPWSECDAWDRNLENWVRQVIS